MVIYQLELLITMVVFQVYNQYSWLVTMVSEAPFIHGIIDLW